MSLGQERRRSRRVRCSIPANVFVTNSRFAGRIVNLSIDGVLVVPRVRGTPETFVGINLFPEGCHKALDLDGIVVRETTERAHYAWGIRFFTPGADTVVRLKAYVDSVHQSGE